MSCVFPPHSHAFPSLFVPSLRSRSKPEDFPTTSPQVRTNSAALKRDPAGPFFLSTDSKHLNLVKLREHDDLFCELVNTVCYCAAASLSQSVHKMLKVSSSRIPAGALNYK